MCYVCHCSLIIYLIVRISKQPELNQSGFGATFLNKQAAG